MASNGAHTWFRWFLVWKQLNLCQFQLVDYPDLLFPIRWSLIFLIWSLLLLRTSRCSPPSYPTWCPVLSSPWSGSWEWEYPNGGACKQTDVRVNHDLLNYTFQQWNEWSCSLRCRESLCRYSLLRIKKNTGVHVHILVHILSMNESCFAVYLL